MVLLAQWACLAQLPEDGLYISPVKLAAVAVVFTLWTMLAQWVDKDTIAVNTYRILWNLIVLSGGAAGTLLALFVPNFLIGFLLMIGVNLIIGIVYVVHRNRLVQPQDTVLTGAHLKRIREQGLFGKKKKTAVEVKERVRIIGADRKAVAIPEDESERERYRLMQDLVFDFFWRRAALAEIIPAGQASRVTYLIDGIPTEREALARADGDALVQYFKEIAGLNVEERRKPQRGRLVAGLGEQRHQVVVETAGSTAGERLRLKVMGLEIKGKVADLGFTAQQLPLVRNVMAQPRGLILVTGPRGSGVTTSIYSFVRSHDAFLQNIQTLEYEREIEVDNITQRLYNATDDNTFTADLQKLVRSDPDIVVLPEVREREAAALAAKAAIEKTKVYVGFQAQDVFDALRRWTALVGDRGAVAKSLAMITNQRLVRRLCAACKQPYKPDAGLLRKLNLPTDAVLYRQPEPQYDKHGNPILCQACQGTGYDGRVGVFDLLIVDDELRGVIRKASSVSEVQSYVLKKGGAGLQAQAMQKVLEGVTSIPEIVRVLRGQKAEGEAARPAAQPSPAPRTASKSDQRSG